MNFAIPRNDDVDLILYIWKIIDLPSISYNNLLYKISFETFISPPDKTILFLDKMIKNNVLILSEEKIISLSKELEKKLKSWQLTSKNSILQKFSSRKKTEVLKSDTSSSFNALLMSFSDKGTINRAAVISDEAFNIKEIKLDIGLIDAEVHGTQKEHYYIKIDRQNKLILHNCNDFQERKAENKKFCKHLAKFFLFLKEKDEKIIISILNDIALNINDWDFKS